MMLRLFAFTFLIYVIADVAIASDASVLKQYEAVAQDRKSVV